MGGWCGGGVETTRVQNYTFILVHCKVRINNLLVLTLIALRLPLSRAGGGRKLVRLSLKT
jgi:hypothetical protein